MSFLLFDRPAGRPFRVVPLLAAGLAAAALCGCGTTIEEAVPGARRSGDYPNLNVPQTAATRQLTDAEAQAALSQLTAARAAQAATAPPVPASEAERLRKLGKERAGQVLEEIER